jgi:hypothetical protein
MSRRLLTTRPAGFVAALCCVGGLAGGCTGPSVPAAGNQFDGTYQGENRLVRGSGWVCAPPSYQDTVAVRGGRFDYTFTTYDLAKPAPIPVQVAADGTFKGQIQYGTEAWNWRGEMLVAWAIVRGRINGKALEGTVADQNCTRQLMLQAH